MRTIGISHKTRYWQHYCFSNPPAGYRYERKLDIPWHMMGVKAEFLANTKFFMPFSRADLLHTYNGVVANPRPWVIEVEDYMPRYETMSRANTVVVPGGKMELAMQLIFTPFVWRMMERRKRALAA